jgi:hypothetical protein
VKVLLAHTLVTLVIVALTLVGYDRFVRRPATRVGLIDVGEVVRLKDARVLDVLTRAATTDGEKKAAVDFGTRFTAVFPQALEELTRECECLVLARSAVAGLPPQAVELTAALKQKVGL